MLKAGTQRTALNLPSNASMNSTTKYAKGVADRPNSHNQILDLKHHSTVVPSQKYKNANLSSPQATNSTNKQTAKIAPSKQQVIENQREKSEAKSQLAAMKLSAQIFMKSTTKFLKGFDSLVFNTNPQRKSKKHSSIMQQSKRSLPINKREEIRSASPPKYQKNNINLHNSKYMNQPFKQAQQKSLQKIVYPSKSKIQRIINSKSQSAHKAESKLQQTLQRNRLNSQLQNRGISSNSYSSKSGSKSLGRFSRKKEKIRQLKFIEKKQISVTEQNQPELQATVKNADKEVKNISQMRDKQTKSADSKITKQSPFVKQVTGLKPIKAAPQKKIIVTSLITPQYSQIEIKPEGYHLNAMLPSGELPLQTPIKPKPIQTSRSNVFFNQSKPKTKPLAQITVIKEENTQSLNSKTIKENNQSLKQQSSTHIDFTFIAGQPNNANNKNLSFDKNQSTIAVGKSEIYGLSTLIKMQESQLNGNNRKDSNYISSIFQPKKPLPKKMDSNKVAVIEVQPIQNTSSFVSQRTMQKIPIGRSSLNLPALQQIPSKSSQTSSLQVNVSPSKANVSSIIASKQPSQNRQASSQQVNIQTKQIVSKVKEEKTEQAPSSKVQKYLNIIAKIVSRINKNNLKASLLKIQNKSAVQKNKVKQASILASSSIDIYHNLYKSNLRASFERLKKISINNPINKKPPQNKINYKNVSANLIYRVCLSKIRNNFDKLRAEALLKDPSEIVLKEREEKIIRKWNYSSQHYLRQIAKIAKRNSINTLQRCFNKLSMFSLRNKFETQKEEISKLANEKQPNRSEEYEQKKYTLLYNKQAFQSQVLRLATKIAQTKRYQKSEKDKLSKQKETLQNSNGQVRKQVQQKSKRNEELKNSLQQHEAKQLDLQLPNQNLSHFDVTLTELYDYIFQQSSQVLNTNQILSKLTTPLSKPSLIQQWQCLALSIKLKSQLSQWQEPKKVTCSKEILLGEQELIISQVRSHIRQRYLWQCVRLTAQKL